MDVYVNTMAEGFGNELLKIAQSKKASLSGQVGKLLTNPAILLPIAGIAGWEILRKAETDRKLGRQLRVRR